MHQKNILSSVAIALEEDLNGLSPQDGDMTASLIPKQHIITAHLMSREPVFFAVHRMHKLSLKH